MQRVLIGVDPSYKRTGISVYYDNKIIIDECKSEQNQDKSFEQVYRDALVQVNNIMNSISKIFIEEGLIDTEVVVMSECPPPQGNFSPGLYGLDMMLFENMQRKFWEVYRLYPTYIMHVHGKRNFQKSESVEIAKDILSYYDVRLKTKRLSHDESESVIFLARNMARNGMLNEELIRKYPSLSHEKEVLLR